MRTFGVEIEFGDVPIQRFGETVYFLQGISEPWSDRSLAEKKRRWDRWDVQTDGGIINSDGTYNGRQVVIDGVKVKYDEDKHAHLNLGAELISPPLNSIDKYCEDVELFLSEAEKFSSPSYSGLLRHAFHVHVDISDYELEDIKKLLGWTTKCSQSFFEGFQDYDKTIRKRRTLSEELNEKIQLSDDMYEVWELYRTWGNKVVGSHASVWRRTVNPGGWFKAKVEGKDWPATVEFRDMNTVRDISEHRRRIESCVAVVDNIKGSE